MTFRDDNTFDLTAPLELKFVNGAPEGTFSGYGAVFGNTDAHGDVIMPGAFKDSLAERKAKGRPIPMHVMHRFLGGDGVPVGVWTDVAEDDNGLKVAGKISGMNTDAGRLLYERVKDGALGGLSIGYRIRPGGSVLGKKPGEPKRTLKALDLHEISLVDDPSNPLSRVTGIKAAPRVFASALDLEEFLHDAGVSNRASNIIATAGFAALTKTTPEIDIDRVAEVLRAQSRELKARSL